MRKKIDIYIRQELAITPKKSEVFWQYYCTTEQARDPRNAVFKFCYATGRKENEVKAFYK
jgi:hypothetical protein